MSEMIFCDFDLENFWEKSDYADETYVGEPLTDELVTSIEEELGCKLPQSYIELMRVQNGGIPSKTIHRTKERTSWAEDHIAISGIYGINRSKPNSLGGTFSSQFWIEEWEYPPIGVYFCDCPSAGHDMLCLDYRACGPQGEPQVVHVDQEFDYKITFVAENFEAFVRGLEDEGAFG
jgi:cell wall assembly regulator SMI1